MSAPLWRLLLSGSDVRKRGLRKYSVFIYALAAAGLVFAAVKSRQSEPAASLQSQCKNNMKQLGLAFRLYHEQYGSFPPAYLTDENGRPAHSWRVLLLPFLDGQAVYRQYRFDEPWNGPNNSKLAERIPEAFRCPRFVEDFRRQTPNSEYMTNYVVVTGSHAIFDGNLATKLSDVVDGASNTIIVAETRKHSVHWMQPTDASADEVFAELRSATLAEQRSKIYAGKCAAIHGLNILFSDGTVRFLSPQTESAVFQGYVTRDGAEDVTVLQVAPYRFYFWSHELNNPPSVHVEFKVYSAPFTAKFWLQPIALVTSSGFEPSEIRELEKIIARHQTEFLDAWRDLQD